MNQEYLECNKVSFSYENGNEIIKEISFRAGHGESIGIIGANGVGKSTLLRILVGLELNFKGEVLINKLPVHKKNLPEIRSRVGYLFQDSENQLFTQSVYHDVAFGLRNDGISEKEVKEQVREALDSIGILHLKDKQIYKLSGGEKKLASIATILARNPDIILLDEPSNSLDPKNRRNLIHILNRLDYIKIIASHDLDLVLDTCERVILMSEGRIICDGSAQQILQNKDLLEANGLELPLCLRG